MPSNPRIFSQSTDPATSALHSRPARQTIGPVAPGDLWIDTSTTPPSIKVRQANDTWEVGGELEAHAASHQNSGSDEISVAGLSGLLADSQTPLAHKASHENVGSDEISVAGLSGLLADAQTPLAHVSSHQNSGTDEISVQGLSGRLADDQPPSDIVTGTNNTGSIIPAGSVVYFPFPSQPGVVELFDQDESTGKGHPTKLGMTAEAIAASGGTGNVVMFGRVAASTVGAVPGDVVWAHESTAGAYVVTAPPQSTNTGDVKWRPQHIVGYVSSTGIIFVNPKVVRRTAVIKIGEWSWSNLAATQTDLQGDRGVLAGADSSVILPLNAFPYAVTFIVLVAGNDNRTAGTAGFRLFLNAAGSDPTATIDGTNVRRARAGGGTSVLGIDPGDLVDIRGTTSADWDPTTAEWIAELYAYILS